MNPLKDIETKAYWKGITVGILVGSWMVGAPLVVLFLKGFRFIWIP